MNLPIFSDFGLSMSCSKGLPNSNCKVIGGLHKTPTLSVTRSFSQDYLGGAAIVASHFRSFTKNVVLSTVINNDQKGKFAKNEIKKLKIKLNQIVENGRNTTNKNSYFVDKHKLLKVDEVNNSPIINSSIQKISKLLKKEKNKIIVCSDFRPRAPFSIHIFRRNGRK